MISSLLKLLGINSSNSSSSKVPKLNTKLEKNSNVSNIAEYLQNGEDNIKILDIESEGIFELEESDIPGIYFNEFREYVDEEGNVLSPSEVAAIRYKDDYEDDYYR